MKNRIFLILLSLTLFLNGYSQKQIRGTVVDSNKEPIIGVNVLIKSTGLGTITDLNGKFVINANEKDSLTFTYIGYAKKILLAVFGKEMIVQLTEESKLLDEVVVIGYGEQNKKDITGSLDELNLDNIDRVPVPNIDMALAGRIAGVQVSANDAQPGTELNIVIRGASSLTQSNAPLYVVDGFPMEDFNSASINPSDIASFNVLKDASATAIYGSRGANGVVIIETKKGQRGKPVITYEGSYGFQQVTKKMDMMSPSDFVAYQIERDPTEMTDLYLTKPGLTLEDYGKMANIDWQNLLFRTAPIYRHSVSVSGGTDRNKYLVSASMTNQDGIVINSGFKKYQGRVKLDQRLTDKINLGININYSNDKNYGQVVSSQGNSASAYSTYLMYRTWGYKPVNVGNADIYNDLFDGDDELVAIMNPIVSSNNEVRQQTRDLLTTNATLDYSIFNNLKLTVRGGFNRREIENEEFNNSKTYRGFPSSNNSKGVNGSYQNAYRFNWVNENMITYIKNFNRFHKFDITAAATMEGTNNSVYGYSVINIPNEELGLSGMRYGIPSQTQSLNSRNVLMSFLSRVNYGYRSKYLFTASIRADGSSKFNPENRWGYFPSAAFAWKMDKEKLIRKLKYISEAKLRLSFGVTGNNRVGDYDRYQSLIINDYYSFANGTPQNALEIDNLGNNELKWEKTAQTNIGYDLSLFKNRIALTVDWYDKTTSALLIDAKLPYSSGTGSSYKNVGKIQNRGLEFSLNTLNIKTKNFNWRSSFNIAFNKNKVLELSEGQQNIVSMVSWTGDWNGTYLYMTKIGGPVSSFYGFVWDGNYQYEDFNKLADGTYVLKTNVATNGNTRESIQPGDIKYVDQNNDGVVNDQDLVIIGNPLPKHIGGFENNFQYKNLTLNVLFQWSYGNDIFNANRIIFEGNATSRNINQFASYNNRWTPDNQNNTYFRVGGMGPRGVYSSRTVEDGSYLRLKTLQLSYSLPKKWVSKIGVKNIDVFSAMNNIFTWTKYTGMDPEVSVRNSTLTPGFDYSAYPQSKTITGGITIVL
ncbi:MAG: TonB-dependent receptor [Paludibacteraceae bacterium]